MAVELTLVILRAVRDESDPWPTIRAAVEHQEDAQRELATLIKEGWLRGEEVLGAPYYLALTLTDLGTSILAVTEAAATPSGVRDPIAESAKAWGELLRHGADTSQLRRDVDDRMADFLDRGAISSGASGLAAKRLAHDHGLEWDAKRGGLRERRGRALARRSLFLVGPLLVIGTTVATLTDNRVGQAIAAAVTASGVVVGAADRLRKS